jgi:hypothetical protein
MAAESVGVCFPVGKLFGIHGNFRSSVRPASNVDMM